MALIVGLPSQQTHFLAHARRRGLLKEWPMIERLQDWRLILHPDAHQQHHEKFNCNFCILNGWANPLMNRVARLLTHFGVLAEEPPTARHPPPEPQSRQPPGRRPPTKPLRSVSFHQH